MREQTATRTLSLYEQDETAWLEQTANLVAQQLFGEIDHEHLSQCLSDMARRDKREVSSRLVILISYLLKWEHQPEQRAPPSAVRPGLRKGSHAIPPFQTVGYSQLSLRDKDKAILLRNASR
jgi:hypothetical protein